MIASPPGRGIGRIEWVAGMLAYLVALPLGAFLTAAVVYLIGRTFGHAPNQVVAGTALLAALASGGFIRLPQSPWMVPKSWARFGPGLYAGLFGFSLGVAVLTALPSPGFYVLLAHGEVTSDWARVLPVFAAFGLARGLPLVFSAGRRDQYVVRWFGTARRAFLGVQPLETILLPAIAVVWAAG